MTERTVHLLRAGLPLCRFTTVTPGLWTDGNVWTTWKRPEDANCEACLGALPTKENDMQNESDSDMPETDDLAEQIEKAAPDLPENLCPDEQVSATVSQLLRDVASLIEWRTESETAIESIPGPDAPRPKTLSPEEIFNRFYYHPPSDLGVQAHTTLSRAFETLATVISWVCPEGRDKSVAITHLETAKFWASAAVARNPETC